MKIYVNLDYNLYSWGLKDYPIQSYIESYFAHSGFKILVFACFIYENINGFSPFSFVPM